MGQSRTFAPKNHHNKEIILKMFGHSQKTSYLCLAANPFIRESVRGIGTIKTLSSVCSDGHELRNFNHCPTDSNERSIQYVHNVCPCGISIIRTGVGYPIVYPTVEGNAKARDRKDRRRQKDLRLFSWPQMKPISSHEETITFNDSMLAHCRLQ